MSGIPLNNRIDASTGNFISDNFNDSNIAAQCSTNDSSKTSDTSNTSIRIGILSDWASGTRESYLVAQHAFEKKYDYNIHMGDTYLTGRYQDCLQNFCGQIDPETGIRGVQFPYGTKGALAVGGNHEAYAHCIGFRNIIMPFCGTFDSNGNRQMQQGPFWSIELDHWTILGLDSAYECVDLQQWNLENNEEAANSKTSFPDLLIQWVQNIINSYAANCHKKGVIILTHHQSLSLFDNKPISKI